MLGGWMPIRTGERSFYLTFDDGPAESTADLLRLLHARGYTATFFWLWSRYRESLITPLLSELWSKGHNVGIHGLTHISAWRTGFSGRELLRAACLWRETGVPLIRAFRPPYGHVCLRKIPPGWKLVLWDLMPPDYVMDTGWEMPLLQQIQPGDVVVLHERRRNMRAWERFFSAAAAAGWKAQALSQVAQEWMEEASLRADERV